MACAAFVQRFMSTCCIWVGLASTVLVGGLPPGGANRLGTLRAQLQHFLDEEVQLERLALLFCLAAKREHLLHQVPGALPSHEDLFQVIPGHALPRHIVQREFCIPQHGAKRYC